MYDYYHWHMRLLLHVYVKIIQLVHGYYIVQRYNFANATADLNCWSVCVCVYIKCGAL